MRSNAPLWTLQVLLAAVFLFAGGMKFAIPMEALSAQAHMPGLFLRFIGVCEIAGAIGLILPWLLQVQPQFTPLAASGLVIIMMGATVVTIMNGSIAGAIVPFVVGAIAAFVAYARSVPRPAFA